MTLLDQAIKERKTMGPKLPCSVSSRGDARSGSSCARGADHGASSAARAFTLGKVESAAFINWTTSKLWRAVLIAVQTGELRIVKIDDKEGGQ